MRVRLENSNWGDEERFHMSFIMLMGFRVVVWRNYFHLISYVHININCFMFAGAEETVARLSQTMTTRSTSKVTRKYISLAENRPK